jgi:hypothetical protein
MFKPPSVNQITSAYTGRMPQLAQRVDQDKKAHGGVPQDLRQLMALNDMTQTGNNAGIQAALQQPMQPPTIAEDIKRRAQQVLQTKMAQAAMQNNQKQGNMGLPAGLPQPQFQPEEEQGIDRLPTNVGESYAHGGIISFAEGDEVPERDVLRRMEAAAYDQTNPTPAPVPQTADEIIMKAMQVNEGQKRAEAEARRGAITRDTTSMDELQAEYKAQRERLNGPKPGFDALMEYLSQVANAPRGISSFAAGAYGAGKQRELEIARQAQQHELTKQMLDVGQKKADIGYQQKMDIYGAGESAEAAAIKDKYAAAINRSTNQFEREKLAEQREMDLKKLALQERQIGAMHINPLLQISNAIGNAKTPEEKQRIQDLFAAQYGNRAAAQAAQLEEKIGREFIAIDKSYEKDMRHVGSFPTATAESKAKFKEMQDEIQTKKDKVAGRYYSDAGKGLPDLAKANSSAPETGGYTVSAGGKTYSFPNAEAAEKFKRDAGVK